MEFRDDDYADDTEEDLSYGAWDGPVGGKRVMQDDPSIPYEERSPSLAPPPSPYGGRNTDLAISPPEEESQIQRDANVNPVTISCEIISYSALREGPGPLMKIAHCCGCGTEDNNEHLDEILHDINGTFRPGELICLMGPSGAGKTTLLNILAARAGGFLVGTVKMNNVVLDQKDMRMMMNYIPQDDTLFGSLTPRETLEYTAKLRIAGQSQWERDELINSLISKLGITPKSADAPVGNDLIVGKGQKKRTSVAMELVTNPSILFVDEATSGMDTATAEDVIRILRDISRTGRTVICTIHQPSFEIFRMFDTLLFLHSGYVVYNGPLTDSTRYFSKMGWTCPVENNPADFFMKILTLEKPRGEFAVSVNAKDQDFSLPGSDVMMVGNKVIHRKPQTSWAAAWKAHTLQTQTGSPSQPSIFAPGGKGGQSQFDDLDYPTGLFEQFYILLCRSLWMTFRDKQQFRVRLLICVCVSIFMGLTYCSLDNTKEYL
jgi:ATP-binding cassette subfamily G (WHITE) protein 2